VTIVPGFFSGRWGLRFLVAHLIHNP
jgi:hypothetical protein